jgi:phosphatidylserine/phosphatidylglycerophosphate/cardiolipin synthase-like enzyme
MKKKNKVENVWLAKPLDDDYSAARSYLTLLFEAADVALLVRRLHAAHVVEYQAKDLLRASQTHLLDKDNPHVADQLKKIKKGKKMSPVLLVKGDGRNGVTLTIADGHHRICASWYYEEDAPIACCVAALSKGA